ncbi:Uncharacterised protein [Mycobacterium tuberculosis]|nr:Uncharacterised protein [Mycobacterium tuberculosis]
MPCIYHDQIACFSRLRNQLYFDASIGVSQVVFALLVQLDDDANRVGRRMKLAKAQVGHQFILYRLNVFICLDSLSCLIFILNSLSILVCGFICFVRLFFRSGSFFIAVAEWHQILVEDSLWQIQHDAMRSIEYDRF